MADHHPSWALCLDNIPVMFGAAPGPGLLKVLEPLADRLSIETWEDRPYPLLEPLHAQSLRKYEEIEDLLKEAGWL